MEMLEFCFKILSVYLTIVYVTTVYVIIYVYVVLCENLIPNRLYWIITIL